MDTPHSFLKAPLLAFYSQPFYRAAARSWRGLGFTYLFLLLLVTWVPSLLVLNAVVRDVRRDVLPAVLAQVPTLNLNNGVLSTDAEMPFVIREPSDVSVDRTGQGTSVELEYDTGSDIIMVIDTGASPADFETLDADVLLTAREIVFIGDDGKKEIYAFSQLAWLGDVRLDRDVLQRFYDVVGKWLSVWLLPVVTAGSFVYRAVQALLFAFVGVIIANTLKLDLSYAALVRLMVVALTPVIVVNTLFNVVNVSLPLWWLLSFLLTMTYLYLAVRANAEAPLAVTA